MSHVDGVTSDADFHNIFSQYNVRSIYVLELVANSVCDHEGDEIGSPAVQLIYQCLIQLLELRKSDAYYRFHKASVIFSGWLFDVTCALSLDKSCLPSLFNYLPSILQLAWKQAEISGTHYPSYVDVLLDLMSAAWERSTDSFSCRNLLRSATANLDGTNELGPRLYARYINLFVNSTSETGADPEYVWCDIQEILEQYDTWKLHPIYSANLARLLTENGYATCLLDTATDILGMGPLLMYGAWSALWGFKKRRDACSCIKLASQNYGLSNEQVWGYVADLTIREVRRLRCSSRSVDRAADILDLALSRSAGDAEAESNPLADRIRSQLSPRSPRASGGAAAPNTRASSRAEKLQSSLNDLLRRLKL